MELLSAFGFVVIFAITCVGATHIALNRGWNIIAVWAILTIVFSAILIFFALR